MRVKVEVDADSVIKVLYRLRAESLDEDMSVQLSDPYNGVLQEDIEVKAGTETEAVKEVEEAADSKRICSVAGQPMRQPKQIGVKNWRFSRISFG